MEYLLLIFYLSLYFWLFPKISFFKNTQLSSPQLRILLILKLLSGVLCAWYFRKTMILGDHVSINEIGKIHYNILLSNPKLFLTDFTGDINRYGWGGLFDSSYSFWAYIRFNLLFKFVAILNLITNGNFYFNSIIFSSIVFFGHIAFYRIFNSMYEGHRLKILFICFFLPSVWLYTSCVHKDGFVFLGIAMISFIFYKYLNNKLSIAPKSVLIFLLGIITIFLFRNYILVALLPAMLIAILCKAYPYKKKIIFIASYSVYSLFFFLTGFLNGFLNLPAGVVKRKADFALLGEGNTNIAMNNLYPTVKSFLINLPQAINHTLFRPYLWEFANPGVILTAIELLFYQMIVLAFVFFRNKKTSVTNSFNLFGYAFFINMMLIIGYTIPNVGAIVRYRGLFWIFILCPLICNTDWSKLNFLKARQIN